MVNIKRKVNRKYVSANMRAQSFRLNEKSQFDNQNLEENAADVLEQSNEQAQGRVFSENVQQQKSTNSAEQVQSTEENENLQEDVADDAEQTKGKKTKVKTKTKAQTKEQAKSFGCDENNQTEAQASTVSDKLYEQVKVQYTRLQADFENYKKRNSNVTAKAYNDGIEEALKAMLPVMDYLDMAILAQKDKNQRKGIELVRKTMADALKGFGVEEMDLIGKEFDPNIAEAVMNKKDDKNSGKVVEVMKKGFIRKEVVLRHAMVAVAE